MVVRKHFFSVTACVWMAAVPFAVNGPATADPADHPGSTGRTVYVSTTGRDTMGHLGPHIISIHTIGADGTLTPLGDTVDTGKGARTIVFGPDGRHAYVAATEENAVYAYEVADNGDLIEPGQAYPAGDTGAVGLAITPNGRTLYVANQSNPGTVSVFAVLPNGNLHLRDNVATGSLQPRNVAVSPDARFLFVSHGTPLDDIPDPIVTFDIHPDGTPGRSQTTDSRCATGAGMDTTPDGRFLYVACMRSDSVFGFRIGADGALTPVPGAKFDAPLIPEGMTMAPDGRHLYVASVASVPQHMPDMDGVWTFAIGDNGTLNRLGPRLDAEDGPVGISITPDGRSLYTSNFFSSNISGFRVDPSSGMLRDVPGPPVPADGKAPGFGSVAVLPNQGPIASFTATPGPTGQPTYFDATASADRDGSIARYDWDFGDGTTLRNGGPRPAHKYRSAGVFEVTLVVTDNERCSTRQVFTGHSALCNGGPAARTARSITIPD
nr:beta-propeller fold lactonase family protein [Kibdelosporangium sp. MJ126-NF4]CEL13122.1 Collagen triple helix repeat domain protein [Kibdelosporangium sp. MJ126-NF4]CTQ98810.1 Collagen triple helix repeat domain protein [Kibdelosporangium sp. MJ126-NF4]